MIDQFVELSASGVYCTVLAAWRALPIFGVALTLALLLRKRIAARYLVLIWMIVVARLLMPFSAPSSFAISSVGDQAFEALTTVEQPQHEPYDTFTYEDESGHAVTVALPDANHEESVLPQAYIPRAMHEKAAAEGEYDVPRETETVAEHLALTWIDHILMLSSYLLLCIWPIGVLIFLFRGVVAHFRYAWRLRDQPAIQDQATVDRLLRVCDSIGVGKRPTLKQVDWIDSPAVFGFFRPVICLPENWREELEGEKLEWVLRHELAHIKRKDGFVLFFGSIAHAFHWFHPISWIALSKLRGSIERSADDLAVAGLSQGSVKAYGELLLEYAANRRSQSPALGLLSMAAPRGLAQRIEALSSPAAKPRWFVRATLTIAIAGIAFCGLTDAKPLEESLSETDRQLNYQFSIPESEWPRQTSSLVLGDNIEMPEVRINVEGVLRKAVEIKPGINAEAFVNSYFGHHEPGKSRVEDGVLITHASPGMAESIKRTLKAFEARGPYQIATELKVVETDVRFLNQYDWTRRNDATCRRLNDLGVLGIREQWERAFPSESDADSFPTTDSKFEIQRTAAAPVWVTKISENESHRLVKRCEQDPRARVLRVPKVVMFDGQSAIIHDMTQRPFVTDLVVDSSNKVPLGGFASVKPKISVFEEGCQFLLTTEMTKSKEISVKGIFSNSLIKDVRIAKMPHASNTENSGLFVQVPTFQSDSVAIESELASNEVLLVFSPTPFDQEDDSTGGLGRLLIMQMQAISDTKLLDRFVEDSERNVTQSTP